MNQLTQEDIEFLKGLAHELKTQDRLYTGKPVIYQIREEDYIVGIDLDYAFDHCIVIGEDFDAIADLEEAKEFLVEYEYIIEDEIKDIHSFSELHDLLEEKEIEHTYTGVYKTHKCSNFFLTKKAMDEHVQQNHYHYKNPDFFVNHAWRNPELQRLLEIVEKFAD